MVVVKRSLEASNPSGSRGRLKTFERLRLKIKLKETSFMPRLRRVFVPALSLFWLISNSATALADASGQSLEERLAKMEAAAASAQSAGDNAWMLVSAALVLMMTGPGLALFYGGLVRKKNVLATMMQSFILMAVVTLLWALYGYSIAFSEGTPFFGGFGHALLRGVGLQPN